MIAQQLGVSSEDQSCTQEITKGKIVTLALQDPYTLLWSIIPAMTPAVVILYQIFVRKSRPLMV